MRKIKHFIYECLWLLWMIFFRPKSYRQMADQLPRWQRLSAVVLILLFVLWLILYGLIRISQKTSIASPAFAIGFGINLAFHFFRLNNYDGGRKSEPKKEPYAVVGFLAGLLTGQSIASQGFLNINFLMLLLLAALLGFLDKIGNGGRFAISTAVGAMAGYILAKDALVTVFIPITLLIICVAISYYCRWYLLLLEVPTTMFALSRVRRSPQQAARYLRYSLAYWDEAMIATQPFLKSLLVAVGEADKKAGMDAVIHVAVNTHQKNAAEESLFELGSRELLMCRTISEIAQHGYSSYWFSPTGASGRMERAADAYARCQGISTEIAAALASTSNYQKLAALNRARRQLEKLRQFASFGLRGNEGRIFSQVVQQWSAAVNNEIDRLTEEERVTEQTPNPYIPLDPLMSNSETFFGRSDIYRFIEENFLTTRRNSTIVLYGQRRIGKSSLLYNLNTRLTTNLISVFVDMQRLAGVEGTNELLFNLANAIYRELRRRGIPSKQPELKDFAIGPFTVFDVFLDEVEEAIHAPENRIILALDEFEVIEQKLIEGKVSGDLLPFLRNMMQHRQGFSLIFAGGHALDEMISDSWIQYFNTAVPLRLSYLDEASARKLITQPIEDFPLNYEPEAVDLLIEQTNCHPCLIQLTCQALVDMKNEQRSRHATVEDVEQALKKSLGNDYALRSLWDWIPENERPLLAWLASAGSASIGQMTRALLKSETEIRGITEHLVKAEVLQREGSPPVYRFQVPLFRQWVARHAVLKGMEFGQRQVAD